MGGCQQAHTITGAWGKEQFLLFFPPRLFHSRKAEGQEKESHPTQLSGLCQVFRQAFLGRGRDSAAPTSSTPQTPKDSWGPWEVAAPD